MSQLLSALALLTVVCFLSGVQAFVVEFSPRTHHRPIARTTRLQSTVEKEQQRLSTDEEKLLFGSEDDAESLQRRQLDKFGNILPNNHNDKNPLDHAQDARINQLRTIRETARSVPELWMRIAEVVPDLRAIYDAHHCDGKLVDLTFQDFSIAVRKSARVFRDLGVSKSTHVAIFAENSAYWLLADQGIQSLGGITAVRGADAPLDELRYIYDHSDAKLAVLQSPKLIKSLISKDGNIGFSNEKYGDVKTIVLLHRDKFTNQQLDELSQKMGGNVKIHVFADLLEAAEPLQELPNLETSDWSTIVYTSGTTGNPKGAVLSHGNLLHQTGHRLAPSLPYEEGEPLPGETMVSLLPVWHITERTFELWMASRGCNIVYSSIRTFKKDLEIHRPQWMVLVPRVLEKVAAGVQDKFRSSKVAHALSNFFTSIGKQYYEFQKIREGLIVSDDPVNFVDKIVANVCLLFLSPLNFVGQKLIWSKVQNGFGGRVKTIISGGSALSGSLEEFYEAAGFQVCVGYGLTECSPLISYRRADSNLVTAGCCGKACHSTELRVVDPETTVRPRPALPHGQVGVVVARGPQVMQGYYKDTAATAKVIDEQGWFDTGDLGRINPATGDLILTGRAKDTIVLSNGENIEPIPIEDAISGASKLIDQVMLTGQDGRSLVAITVLNPMELAELGILDRNTAVECQTASDKVNDPKCTPEDCQTYSKILRDVNSQLRGNKELGNALEEIFRVATKDFRKWERVNDYYVTLEPFAMANGLLTQSYKVKRNSVQERYAKEVAKQ